jgi:hypothetical protein
MTPFFNIGLNPRDAESQVSFGLPEAELGRRRFLQTCLGAAVAAGSFSQPVLGAARPDSETLVATLYHSLTEEQKRAICFPFEHPLRQQVDNNWLITDHSIGSLLKPDQIQMVREIFLGLHSPEYADRVLSQVRHDSGKDGFEGGSAIGLFGEPGTGKFEFVLTGRHCTRRCDGDSVDGAAFGGPIFYGHAAQGFNEKPDHPGNAYWFQAVRANEVFQMLDGKQREQALLDRARRESGTDTVRLSGSPRGLAGIRVGDLSADQKEGVQKVLRDLLAPFRKKDADEVMKLVRGSSGTGMEDLHLSFYKGHDIGNDGIWDVWQVEGPNMIWYFRGQPHVHVWVHVRA